MVDAAGLVSFQVIPGRKAPAEVEERLRDAGFERIEWSPDGRRLHIIAPRSVVDRAFGCSLVEKRRRQRVGPVERETVDWELPQGVSLPPGLQDVIAQVVFPVSPDYYQSPAPKRKGLL